MPRFKTSGLAVASVDQLYAAVGISERASINTRRGTFTARSLGPIPGPGGIAAIASVVMSGPITV